MKVDLCSCCLSLSGLVKLKLLLLDHIIQKLVLLFFYEYYVFED